MKARVQVVRKNKTTLDQIWKNKKQFAKNSVVGCMADKIHLDIDLESVADVMALLNWCEMSWLCFKK